MRWPCAVFAGVCFTFAACAGGSAPPSGGATALGGSGGHALQRNGAGAIGGAPGGNEDATTMPTMDGAGGASTSSPADGDATRAAADDSRDSAPTESAPTRPDAPPAAPSAPFPLAALTAAMPELYVKAATHLEGPSWRNGELFFAGDGPGWGLMRVDPSGKLFRYQPKLQPIGTYLLGDGSLLVCDHALVLVQVFQDGKAVQLATDFQGQAIENCNDVAVDGPGNIYVSARHSGIIFRISPAGDVVKVASGIDLPNGVEVDPASQFLYFVNGLGGAGRVSRIALPANGGNFGAPEMVGSAGQPDGLQFDAWGNLWVAAWSSSQIFVFAPDKKVVTTIPLPGAINLTFGGNDDDTVFAESDGRGIYKIGPVKGLRGFLHPGAAKYQVKKTLDFVPANQPAP